MITALVVVLAAVLFFWLTGDKKPKSRAPRDEVEHTGVEEDPGYRGAMGEGEDTAATDEAGTQVPRAKRKRTMPRPQGRSGGAAPRSEGSDKKRSSTPLAPGAPQR